MRGQLKRKTTRTVHGQKVVRLRIDIPFEEVEDEGDDDQDMNKWLDASVDELIRMSVGPFNVDGQQKIDEITTSDG